MKKTFCDVTGVVMARDRLDGGRPDLRVEAIRRMVERGEIRPAPELLRPSPTPVRIGPPAPGGPP